MRRVQILSPFRGKTPAERDRNEAYARADVFDENDPEQRAQGISAGLEWLAVAEAVVVYEDYGVSEGMAAELRAAEIAGVPVEFRNLPGVIPF